METLTESFYLQRRSLGLAGVDGGLIGGHWDLWEEEVFSLCKVQIHSAVSA